MRMADEHELVKRFCFSEQAQMIERRGKCM